MKYSLLFLLFFLKLNLFDAQAQQKDSFSLQLFGEVYASSIPNKPINKIRPGFHYNYTKANTAGVNLALARVHYSKHRFRSNFGLMVGDYPQANLADEPKWTRNFFEANAGYKIANNHDLWLDIGLLPSHIGIESAVGKDNWTATRSIVADNSPYYETGVRVSYKPNAKWYTALLTVTGWQNITIPAGQRGPGWGFQVTYVPHTNASFNHSSFIGDVVTPAGRGTRIYFHNSAILALNQKSAFTLGWDFGIQPSITNLNKNDSWNGWILLYRYAIKPGKWYTTLRYERFIDNNNVLFSPPPAANSSFNLHHGSINLDWQPAKGWLLRAEANYQQSPDLIFYKDNQFTRKQFSAFIIASYNFQYSKKR